MSVRRARGRIVIMILASAVALATPAAMGQPVAGIDVAETVRRPVHIDPAALNRGDDPRIAYLVRDTIHDGDRRVRVWPRGRHWELWETDPGYVVWDSVGRRSGGPGFHWRVVAVDRDGDKRLLGRSKDLLIPVVSPSGRRVALVNRQFPADDERAVIRVVHPHTGRVIARRTFGPDTHATAVTDRRVLVDVPGSRRAPTLTWWWNYRSDTMRRVSGWRAIDADVRADRVVFSLRASGITRCRRVAPLSHPRRTLWRECRLLTYHWNAKGTRALASLPPWQWDLPGTDRWVVVKGRSGEHTRQVVGQLNWGAAWEGNKRFLTIARNEQGRFAVIRCRFDGRCERASRLWQFPVAEDAVTLPVTLAQDA
jgi:hypothetical protein